ncbi:MAG TPA: hypothetical protein VGL34_20920 [Steroidobacteraceae bacterium]|jgi:hypothetical protein
MTFVSQDVNARYLAAVDSEATGFWSATENPRWVRTLLLTNNCEHFCEWCLCGTARSFQVEAWLARPRLTLLATLRLVIRVPMSSLSR